MKKPKKLLSLLLTLSILLSPALVTDAKAVPASLTTQNSYLVDYYKDVVWITGGSAVINTDKIIMVEQNQTFNIGDFAHVDDRGDIGSGSNFKAVSYSSSNKSVASVNSKGFVKTKKTGKTTLTLRYKGAKHRFKIKVVKAGRFGNSEAIQAAREASRILQANMPTKVTTANGYKCLQIIEEYEDKVDKYADEIITWDGFLMGEAKDIGELAYASSYKLAVPQMARWGYLINMFGQYADKYSPTSAKCTKKLKIASISANTEEITVRLKNAPTKAHILATNFSDRFYNESINEKTVKFSVRVYDEVAKKDCIARATMTKGSKIIKIRIGKYVYQDGDYVYTDKKLKKGHKYTLGDDDCWPYGKSVRVK